MDYHILRRNRMKTKRIALSAATIILLLCLATTISALEPRLHPLDFSQQVSPNSDGQVEGDTEVFFNWGFPDRNPV